MPFNHYARLKQIIAQQPEGWYIARIDKPTEVINFKGEKVVFDHYYRLIDADNNIIRYGKFQQIERFAKALSVSVESLPVIENTKIESGKK